MKTLKYIREKNLKAIKDKDVVAKSLYSTLIGEIENTLKNDSSKTESSVIENLAKKFTENARIVGNEDSKYEIDLLTEFLPMSLTEEQYISISKKTIESNTSVVEEIKTKNPGKIGYLMGLAIKLAKTEYPGYDVDAKAMSDILKLSI